MLEALAGGLVAGAGLFLIVFAFALGKRGLDAARERWYLWRATR